MAAAKQSAKQPGDNAQLKDAVADVAQEAEQDAKTGNVATVKETTAQPDESLPTGTRRSQSAE